ncbi:efflux RND transporter periplasmic adaptor subunit [Peteryoungia ipomoeae]|uniref:Efflux RND transporter periplasmic adaptor subunit n=1 Tax=Peteryoungia ipomoeae TaxID=1210932 RepID=A0A4S8NU47_9HYPH|nr:efflux RND transporter periplasmic adaptor subunit [Peteryoungia ipomoeae]THV21077.1 efflux RND transporter periplasmic adaptor subunit [Peteryoungia ipomoeae]
MHLVVSRLSLPILMMLALTACNDSVAQAPAETSPRPVKVIEVQPLQNGSVLRYSGIVTARSEAPTGFRVAGKITERLVDVGDRVSAGQLLARLDGTDLALQLDSAKASLEAAERQVETAQFAETRAANLFAQKVTTKAQLEQAELSLNQAIANRDSARAALAQAQNQLSYSELRADTDGIVTAVSADAGQVLPAGNPVVTLATDGERDALIAVPENEILSFSAGKKVQVNLWAKEGVSFEGTIREVAGSADPASRTFAVKIGLGNRNDALLGMTARVLVNTDAKATRFELPLSALTQDGARQAIVWKVDRGGQTAHAKPVTLEAFSDKGVQISEGLSAGDLVVVAGTQFMQENLKVALDDEHLARVASTELSAPTH